MIMFTGLLAWEYHNLHMKKKVKQGHCQPRFYSKARALSTQLYNFRVENMLVTVYFIWTLRMKSWEQYQTITYRDV